MMLRNIDISSALRRVADRKIEEAMRNGKFNNLEGAGKPLELEPMPADENARMMWWAMRLFKQNDVVPDEIRYRKSIAALQARLKTAPGEAVVRSIVTQVNEVVVQLNTMGTNAIPTELPPLDAEAEVARWQGAQTK